MRVEHNEPLLLIGHSGTPLRHVIATNIKEYLPAHLRLLFSALREKKEGHRITLQAGDRGQELIVPFYVFHQPPIVVLAFFAAQWPVGLLVQLAVIVLGALAITLGLCEGVARRVRPARALFGMKPSWRPRGT